MMKLVLVQQQKIISILNSKYQCIDEHPKMHKDVNELLLYVNKTTNNL